MELPLHIGNSLESKNFNIFLILNNVKNKKKYQDKNHIIIDILHKNC